MHFTKQVTESDLMSLMRISTPPPRCLFPLGMGRFFAGHLGGRLDLEEKG
jgi:hypothetical protein